MPAQYVAQSTPQGSPGSHGGCSPHGHARPGGGALPRPRLSALSISALSRRRRARAPSASSTMAGSPGRSSSRCL
eukprot:scaffold76849_cov60-Phaeocystis_antarctica.AAC.1